MLLKKRCGPLQFLNFLLSFRDRDQKRCFLPRHSQDKERNHNTYGKMNAQKDVCLKSRFCFTNNAHTKASQLGLPRWKDWWLSEERRQILSAVAAAEPSPPAETAGDETAGDETAGESRRVRVGYISRYAKPVVLSHLYI